MNQFEQDELELVPLSVSHPSIEQRSPNMMQQAPGSDQLANAILQIALENSVSIKILADLARTIGQSFAVNGCIVITRSTDSWRANQVSYSQTETGLFKETVIEQLTHLEIQPDGTESSLVEATSSLFKKIDGIIKNALPTQTWLGITTQSQGRTNGLVLLFKSGGLDWSEAEQQLLRANIQAIAIVIAQAQLQEQAHSKSRYQNLLSNLSQEISQGYQLELLLQNCLEQIGQALQVDRQMILLFKYRNPLKAKRDRDLVKGTANISYQWSADAPALSLSAKEPSFSLNNSDLCQKAWRNAPNCLNLAAEAPFPDLTVESMPTRGNALLMMPLMGKKTSQTDSAMVLGFLVVQSDLPRHWSEAELDLINWVGVQMSMAIIQEQTVNRVNLMVDERTAHLKSSVDMQGKLSARMRQHIEQLQKLNHLKDDFLNSMSHELKTPLTSMKIAIKMLRQSEISPQMREKYLDILEQEWNREYNLIKDLLTLQQVESGEFSYSPQELDLTKTIEDLQEVFATKWQSSRDLKLVCDLGCPDLKIHTDAESLEYILQELLTNASKYGDAHTTIELSVSQQLTAQQPEIVIAVANVGEGITPEELPHIFDKFRRGQGVTDRAVPGTGLGLTLVQYLVEHLHGKIEVTSNPWTVDQSKFLTTFILKLPQIQLVHS